MDAASQARRPESPQVVRLDATLDLVGASGLARSLAALRGTPLAIDPLGVERVGAQGLQVLIAAARSWRADGVAFAVTRGSAAFDEALNLLGLVPVLANEKA